MKTVKNKVSRRFGESVSGYTEPVLNEREIRAAAGIMFLMLFISLVYVIFRQNFLLVKYVIAGFFIDFIIRVLINPRYSPVLILGRLVVSRQVPEYTGARQKKFAWTIGLVLSGLMVFLVVILNSYSIIASFTCITCLVFLFFETAFGICIGCIVYRLFYKYEKGLCAGQVCDQKGMHVIQKISRVELLSLFTYLLMILLGILFLNDYFRNPPISLWDL